MSNIQNVKNGVYTYKDESYNFNFYTDIDVSKKISFVSAVTDIVVTENHYQSVVRDLIFDFQIIAKFSNALDELFDVFGKLDDGDKTFSLSEIDDIINNTEIVEIIKANAVEGLIDELNEAVDRDIEYKTGIHRNPLAEGVASLLGTLESKIKDINLDSLMGFAEVFNNISGDLTPEGIIDAYGKSDVFKQIREEADERSLKRIEKIVDIANKNDNNDKDNDSIDNSEYQNEK